LVRPAAGPRVLRAADAGTGQQRLI
jgi:hypothetical protein